MKRRFVLPAAIALAGHAMLFVGSSRPPVTVEPPIIAKPRPIDESPKEDPLVLALTSEDESLEHFCTGLSGPDRRSFDRPLYEGPNFDRDRGTRIVVEGTDRPVARPSGDDTGVTLRRLRDEGPSMITAAMLDRPPQVRRQIAPDYPRALKALGVGGEVLVEFTVDETGRVHEARVLRASRPELEEPTLRAVREWRFAPGKRYGVPVRFRVSVPVQFAIANEA